jgi:hypothetical protein
MKKRHVCLFCGTARKNLERFNPSRNEWINSKGQPKKNANKWFEIYGIRFVRMTTTPEADRIDYENYSQSGKGMYLSWSALTT